MEKALNVDNSELEQGVSELVERVESQPEQWYKLLIERLVKQELMLEKLIGEVNNFKDLEKLNSIIIDNKLLESPIFFRNTYEVRAINNLWPDQGFYDAETHESGLVTRWTKQNFYFEIPVKREKEKQIRLHLLNAIKDEVLENMECYANGTPISLTKISSENGMIFEGILSKSTSFSITRLSFHTKTSFSPKEIDPSAGDTRMLAAVFTKLTVK